jgi:uncharacterized membrane protein
MDEIEGFRMYLSVAEEERLNLLNPPAQTPALFEELLPYALALDVENEWNDKFSAVLAAAGSAPGESGTGYRPRWYRGSRWHSSHAGSFGRTLGSGLGMAVASSVTAPGSSSGSSGGGSSGGGGGGGGGGGW